MASTIQSVCDAILLDLQTFVPAITNAIPHLYAPWDYELLSADRGETHIAVHITQEAMTPLSTDAHELTQIYEVLMWQDAKDEGAKGINDQAANLAWLVLFESVRARLYQELTQTLSGTSGVELCWYKGATFAGVSSLREFSVQIEVKTIAAFS